MMILALQLDARIKELCREEKDESLPRSISTLQCSMIINNNKYLALGPLKFELKNDRAMRAIIHEFLSERELDFFNKRFRSLLKYEYSAPLITTGYKVGQIAKSSMLTIKKIFYDKEAGSRNSNNVKISNSQPQKLEQVVKNSNYDHLYLNSTTVSEDLLEKISKRIELITTLNVTKEGAASKYRVSLYGLGGMTESHSDVYSMSDLGDNIATFMVWLKDVAGGGGTYFSSSLAKQVMMPVKGSALIWINSLASGASNILQDHGGCPVCIGSKFTLSRWIYNYPQWKGIPCGIDEKLSATLPFYRM